MNRIRALSFALLFVYFKTATGDDTLLAKVQAVINQPEFKHAHWGLLVVDPAMSTPVFEMNADHLFAPASTTKLFSVATALESLGPGHHFETPVVRHGEAVDGVLKGDLILIASGDLTMGGRTDAEGRIAYVDNDHTYSAGSPRGQLTPQDPLAGLNELAKQVATAGVKRIEGDVLLDDRMFAAAPSTGSGPSRVSPILINDNLVDLVIAPGSNVGDTAKVTHRPESVALAVDAQVETVAKGKDVSIDISSPGGNRIVVRGRIPVGRKPLVRVREVADPASFARSLFVEALIRAGVQVTVSPLATNVTDRLPPREQTVALPRVAMLTSPPLSEHAKLILKVSHNLHASTLPLLVAVKNGGRTLEEGLRAQGSVLRQLGIDVDQISFGGGAGGSFSDLTTPRVTVQLLLAMKGKPYFDVYREALPILGVDGTLAKSVPNDSPAKGKVRAKTGTYTVTNVMNHRAVLTSKALAGYMTTASNRELVCSFVINNAHMKDSQETDHFGRVLGKLCEVFVTGL